MSRSLVRSLLCLLAGLTLSLAACGDDAKTSAVADTDTGTADGSGDGSGLADTSETDGSGSGEDTTADVYPTVSCTADRDCPEFGLCVDGLCQAAPTCRALDDWPKCERLLNAIKPDLGRFAACVNKVCRVRCTLDTECRDGETCTDFGECVPFTGEVTGEAPGGDVPGTFRAGFGNTLMNFPIGTEMGGFGERAAFEDGRYATTLRASVGETQGLFAKTMVIDNGSRQLMFIRLPVIFIDAAFHEAIARHLQERTGKDWRDSLVISTTHTHSGPCRHWHMPTDNAAPIGAFGIGNFHQQFFDWLIESTIQSADAALDDLRPAKFGAKIVEAYDTDDQVGRDRWNQTPHFDDNRALLFKVAELDGRTRGVLFSFAAHGTLNGADYVTGDALGGAEEELGYALSADAGANVHTMFFNQNSGTMSPAGDFGGQSFPASAERLGQAFAQKVKGELDALETKTDVELDGLTYRFPVTYDLLGYARGEFASTPPRPFGGEYHYGGLSCVDGQRPTNDQDPATFQRTDHLVCSAALHFLVFNRPPTMLLRSQITALKVDGLTLVTMPGELAEELSWDVLQKAKNVLGIDPLTAWTFGYAQDHFFYLLPTNLRGEKPPFPGFVDDYAPDDFPEYTFSFLQGGYESTVSPWGPKLGDYMRDRAVDAMKMLGDRTATPGVTAGLPSQFTHVEEEPFPIDTTPVDRVGVILQDMPETLERLQPAEFAWVGGDPGAEMPQAPLVILQKLGSDGVTFENVILPDYTTYSNRSSRFLTRIRQPDEVEWQWVVRWEELYNFPTGTYRFYVSGKYLSSLTDTTLTPYVINSRPFELLPTGVNVTAAQSGNTITGTLSYDADAQMNFSLNNAADPGAVAGNYRLRNGWTPSGSEPPAVAGTDLNAENISVSLRQGTSAAALPAGAITLATAGQDGGPRRPVTTYNIDTSTLSGGDWTAEITVTDLHGNSGTTTLSITIP